MNPRRVPRALSPLGLGRLEHHDRDQAVCAGLVHVVLALIDLVGACPRSGAFLSGRSPDLRGALRGVVAARPLQCNGMKVRAVTLLALLTLCFCFVIRAARAGTEEPCAGDCSQDRRVAIDELITLVNIATERAPLSRCPILLDPPRIDYLVQAVNRALRGCDGAGPTPTPVPPGFPCGRDADCDTHQFCRAPGAFLGCGVCIDPPVIDDNFTRCTTDDDCADSPNTPRCDPLGDATDTCPACEGEVFVCFQPACATDDECETSEMCEQHRCRGRQCTQDGHCPTTHRCAASADVRRCQRRACTAATDCGDGFCVNRLCYDESGRCTLRPS